MKRINMEDARKANGGGKVYDCPFCHNFSGSYWKTYAHALKCSYFNSKVYRIGWSAAFKLLMAGLG